jgi:hypothetical protein
MPGAEPAVSSTASAAMPASLNGDAMQERMTG